METRITTHLEARLLPALEKKIMDGVRNAVVEIVDAKFEEFEGRLDEKLAEKGVKHNHKGNKDALDSVPGGLRVSFSQQSLVTNLNLLSRQFSATA
jgi:hypothetical protein